MEEANVKWHMNVEMKLVSLSMCAMVLTTPSLTAQMSTDLEIELIECGCVSYMESYEWKCTCLMISPHVHYSQFYVCLLSYIMSFPRGHIVLARCKFNSITLTLT
jgi:hypothetical protein